MCINEKNLFGVWHLFDNTSKTWLVSCPAICLEHLSGATNLISIRSVVISCLCCSPTEAFTESSRRATTFITSTIQSSGISVFVGFTNDVVQKNLQSTDIHFACK